MPRKFAVISALLAVIGLALWAPVSSAFPTYSRVNTDDPEGPGIGNCKGCHGDFRDDNYISRTDGTNWGNLHDLHRNVMLAGPGFPDRCWTCHLNYRTLSSGTHIPTTPVYTYQSLGGNGLDAISCVGCHGRYEDRQEDHHNGLNGNNTHGMGAGLRQHHWKAGITYCERCHEDANPANFTPVGEHVQPPHYVTHAPQFQNKPTESCNYNRQEDYAGRLFGLDNDGDGKYDITDSDCTPPRKVMVCHVPPNAAGEPRTIWININALDSHAAHGDLLGACTP